MRRNSNALSRTSKANSRSHSRNAKSAKVGIPTTAESPEVRLPRRLTRYPPIDTFSIAKKRANYSRYVLVLTDLTTPGTRARCRD